MQIVIDVTLNDLKYFSWKLGIDIIILDLYYNDIKLEWLTDPLSEFYHDVDPFFFFFFSEYHEVGIFSWRFED